MLARYASIADLELALKMVNERYGGNITFRDIRNKTRNSVRFTLGVKQTVVPDIPGPRGGKRFKTAPGVRLGMIHPWKKKQTRIAAACWHVHGHFFDALFSFCPAAIIVTSRKKITASYGNWEDFNIGSMMYPLYFSEACECGE